MKLTDLHTRHLFFTGKGGVGKTSLACATGIALAESGQRVLIVSTDPASNLDEVLGVALGPTPTPVPQVEGLFALNIDPHVAARDYRERTVAPYRGILPPAAIHSMEEQFSGACTVEIAAFDEFANLLGAADKTRDFNHVLFDTAPTGHTLRLLALPSAWNDFIAASSGGASCLGPLAGLEQQRALYAATVAELADATRTTIVLVARAETGALREAERAGFELASLGISHQVLVINSVFQAEQPGDVIADALTCRTQAALAGMPPALTRLPRLETPFHPAGLVGIAALRRLEERRPPIVESCPSVLPDTLANLESLVGDLEAAGPGVIMTMGKGGVGKTTVAAALATALAQRGHRVLLSTTDPAAHLAETIDTPVPGLSVSRIDPATEVATYQQEILQKAGSQLDDQGRALLEEDLRSPCTEEIAVFRAFARTVDAGQDGFVVLDTAPTGHTILLLDAAEAYHREVLRVQGDMPQAIRQLLPRLRDPAFTRVILTTLPEATPVHEAERLQADLRRAGIEPYAWVINQSFLLSGTQDPALTARGRCELPYIRHVAGELSVHCALVPWLPEPPIGLSGLTQMMGRIPQSPPSRRTQLSEC
jgi:arsenite-transporting ATPase